jgi:hypothetical protein
VNTRYALDYLTPWIESLRLFATEVVPNVHVEGTHE